MNAEALATAPSLLALQEARKRREASQLPDGALCELYRRQHAASLPCEDDSKRLRVAGIPRKHWGVDFARQVHLRKGEFLPQLRRRAQATASIAVIPQNVEAVEWLETWSSGSVWIQGAVGRGKSMLLAAVLSRVLLEPIDMAGGWGRTASMEPGEDEVYGVRRTGGSSVAWSTISEIMTDQENHRRYGIRTTRTPIQRAKEVAVLVLDDVLAETGSKARTDWVTNVLEDIVGSRYNEGLPILFSSNKRLDEVGSLRSERLQSRINELTSQYAVECGGPDWRAQ